MLSSALISKVSLRPSTSVSTAVALIDSSTGEGSTTVGAMMNTSHVKPSPVDESIKATAVLTEVEGRKLTFEIKAEDSKGIIGEAVHVRYIVDRERFMSKF